MSDLLNLFLSKYKFNCKKGPGLMTLKNLQDLCNELNISFDVYNHKKELCKKIKNHLLENSLKVKLENIMSHMQTSIKNMISNNLNEKIGILLTEINDKINQLNLNEQDSNMLKSKYIETLNYLSIHKKITQGLSNTLNIIQNIILKKPLPEHFLQLNLPIFYTDYYKNSSIYVPLNFHEEDVIFHDSYQSKPSFITQQNDSDLSSCINNDYIMNEPYTQEDPPMQIYTLNSKYTFEKSSCLTYDELFSYIGTGKNTKAPEVLQTIYKCDFKCEDNGKHSYATGKLIVKIPPNNIYVTLGSIERMIKSHTHIKHWYALPLYKRRIGNLDELFSSSRNHGQIP